MGLRLRDKEDKSLNRRVRYIASRDLAIAVETVIFSFCRTLRSVETPVVQCNGSPPDSLP